MRVYIAHPGKEVKPILVNDIMVFDCGCAVRVVAISHPGSNPTLGFHVVSVCANQVLEIGLTYDCEEYYIEGGYFTVQGEVYFSHTNNPVRLEMDIPF